MFNHKFAEGDRVLFKAGSLDRNVRDGLYAVIRALPDAGRGCQYRVRHLEDEHERVIDEAQLRRSTAP